MFGRRIIKAYWFLGLGLLILLAAGLSAAEALDQLRAYTVVIYYASQITLLLACLIIPLALFVTLRQFKRLRLASSPLRSGLLLVLSVLMLVAANMVACGILPRQLLTGYHNLSSMYWKDHLYRLDSIITGVWSDLDEELLLWECDASGWFCRVIYAQEYYIGLIPKLTSEPRTDLLLLVINSKVAYVHRP